MLHFVSIYTLQNKNVTLKIKSISIRNEIYRYLIKLTWWVSGDARSFCGCLAGDCSQQHIAAQMSSAPATMQATPT